MEAPARAQATGLGCSFCGKAAQQVERLIAGPGVYICDGCVGLCTQILATERAERAVESLGSLDDKDVDELLAATGRLDASRAQVAEAVEEYVRELRTRGVAWSRIGDALGVSRQSAWERFSRSG